MAVSNPADFLSNAGPTHTAADLRTLVGGLLSGLQATSSLKSAGGVHPNLGNKLLAQQTITPSMSVDVLNGYVFVPGTESSVQGVYGCFAPTTTNLGISTAHATLPRIDRIVAKVEDSAYSGSVDAWSLVVITGTAASSPVPPALPNNSFALWQVSVGAAVTSITNSDLTDERVYTSSVGGETICTHATRPTIIHDNLHVYETDTDYHLAYRASTSTWVSSQERIVYKVARQTRNMSTTYFVDNTLVFPVEALSRYTVKLFLSYLVDPAANLKFRFVLPSGSSAQRSSWLYYFDTGTLRFEHLTGLVEMVDMFGSASLPTPMSVELTFDTGATAGTVTTEWAQYVLHSSNFSVDKGSRMEINKIG